MTRWLRSVGTKPYVVMPTVAVLIFSGWFAVQARGSGADNGATDNPAEQVVDVTVGPMSRTVSAQGTVAAAEADDLNFAAAGTVTAVNVKAGDKVNAGDVLATMDSPVLRQAVADAEARVAAAQATLSDDTASNASSTRLAADRSSLTSARNNLTEANNALAGSTLKAPYAAKVSSVGVALGDKLGADGQPSSSATGSDSGTGRSGNNLGNGDNGDGASSAAVALISLDSYKVDLGFDSNDIGSLASGQAAKVTLSTASSSSSPFGPNGPKVFNFGGPASVGNAKSASSDDTPATTTPVASDAANTTGAVASVSTVADASSGVASYPVVVTFNDSSGSFNVGATVQVDITVSQIDDAVQVPVAAVTPGDGGVSTVTVRGANGDEVRSVETGLTSDGMMQITRGLSEGEQVVISFGNVARRFAP
jgi:multidrug efflux pump subunit AcrA (membrane-fusion protein)